MANNEFKTTVISYDEREPQTEAPKQEQSFDKTNLQNVLFNITTKVPHVTETLPTVKIETDQDQAKVDLRSVQKINENAKSFPKFYIKEYKRSFRLVIMWIILTLACAGLEAWALAAIIQSPVNNWTSLILIPAITLCIAMLVVYINNWVNFRNEARSVDFSQGKIPTISVMKLYKRLKTAHINVNWFCCLAYVAGGLTILITYIVGWAFTIQAGTPQWGVLIPTNFPPYDGCGWTLLIIVAVTAAGMIAAFFMHVILLVTNYTRSGKIDSFYSVQIVSDEELNALKKKKNRRDLFIFLAVVMVLALIGILIYKIIKSKKVNNTVTINNGPTVKPI